MFVTSDPQDALPVCDDGTADEIGGVPAPAGGESPLEAIRREGSELERCRYAALRDAATWRGLDGWTEVGGPEDWAAISATAAEAFRSDRFLVERLGAERCLDPALMATLLGMRQQLLAEHGRTSAAAAMPADLALLVDHS